MPKILTTTDLDDTPLWERTGTEIAKALKDALAVYAPEYMHGLPLKGYLRAIDAVAEVFRRIESHPVPDEGTLERRALDFMAQTGGVTHIDLDCSEADLERAINNLRMGTYPCSNGGAKSAGSTTN